jgi:hypothetical protein
MNRILAATVLLLVALAIGFARDVSDAPAGPRVIARISLANQTAAIPTTTVFTPADSGLFRASAYMTMTTPGTGGAYWVLPLNWTDDAGEETTFLAQLPVSSVPPQDYGLSLGGEPNCTVVFRAVGGMPVTYSVYAGNRGTYALFMTIEKLD